MLFAVICRDKPDLLHVRTATREAHLAYLAATPNRVKVAGPLLSDDGSRPIGSLLLISAGDRDELENFVAQDPYRKAGLFAHVEITPWKWVIGAPKE